MSHFHQGSLKAGGGDGRDGGRSTRPSRAGPLSPWGGLATSHATPPSTNTVAQRTMARTSPGSVRQMLCQPGVTVSASRLGVSSAGTEEASDVSRAAPQWQWETRIGTLRPQALQTQVYGIGTLTPGS